MYARLCRSCLWCLECKTVQQQGSPLITSSTWWVANVAIIWLVIVDVTSELCWVPWFITGMWWQDIQCCFLCRTVEQKQKPIHLGFASKLTSITETLHYLLLWRLIFQPHTFEKALNKYLYILLQSAPAPGGVLKSTIFGNICWYWLKNTHLEDYKSQVCISFSRLQQSQGPTYEDVIPIFEEAFNSLVKDLTKAP
jgi:hypothetical protein